MRAVTMEDMRTVDGGKTKYRTLCKLYTFYDTPAGVAKAKLHYAFCSKCKAYNKKLGYWYTFG